MSGSTIFWVDTLLSLVGGTLALALLFLVVGLGVRRRLNQVFGLYAVSAAVVGLGSAAANISFWIETTTPEGSGHVANARWWMELAVFGRFYSGPALLALALVFGRALKQRDSAAAQPTTRLLVSAAVIVFIAGLALLPVTYNHRIVTRPQWDQSGLSHWELTPLGQAALAGPVLLMLAALVLLWPARQNTGPRAMMLSTAIWLVGLVGSIRMRLSSPVETIALGVSVLITAYVVAKDQVFGPLRNLTEQFDATVSTRTGELAKTLEALERSAERQQRVAQMGREIAQETGPAKILERLVESVHNGLGFHHVYVYLPDSNHQRLVIQAAAGTTARTVMENGHRLEIGGPSLSGRAAAEQRALIAEARDDSTNVFGDTALPGARSELAAPLLIGSRLVGLIDLQSIHDEAFSCEDLALVTSLAHHIAISLDRARLQREMEAAKDELKEAQRRYLDEAWKAAVSGFGAPVAFTYRDGGNVEAASGDAASWPPDLAQAATLGHTVTSSDHGQTTVSVPITLRGRVIGAMQLRHKAGRSWQTCELDALHQIAERLAGAIETSQLAQFALDSAKRERLVREITEKVHAAPDIETIARTAAEELAHALGGAHSFVKLNPRWYTNVSSHKDEEWQDGVLYEFFRDALPSEKGHLPQMDEVFAKGVSFTTVGESGQPAALVAPIKFGAQVIGALGLQAAHTDAKRAWGDDDTALVEMVADRVGQTLEAAHLYDQSLRRARREQQVTEITGRIRSAPDMDGILRTAVQEIRRALAVSYGVVRLGTETYLRPNEDSSPAANGTMAPSSSEQGS